VNVLEKMGGKLEQRLRSSSDHQIGLRAAGHWSQWVTWTLVGGTAAGVAWLAFAQTEQIVVADGVLEPLGQVREISLPVGGVANNILVREGQAVRKGDVLLQLDTAVSQERQKSLNNSLQLKQQQLQYKQRELERYLQLNSAESRGLSANLELNRQIQRRLNSLANSGAVAELQKLQQDNKVKELEGQLEQNGIDRQRQTAVQDQQIQSLQVELADLSSRLNEQDVTLRYQKLRSPVDGWVFDLKPRGAGFVADGSQPVLRVVPFGSLNAKVMVSSADIGFVRVGQDVEVAVDAFPSSDFGVIKGRVSRVSSDALPPAPQEGRQAYAFPLTVALTSQVIQPKKGDSRPLALRAGMSVKAHIKLRKLSYLDLLLGSLKSKSDSLRQL